MDIARLLSANKKGMPSTDRIMLHPQAIFNRIIFDGILMFLSWDFWAQKIGSTENLCR